MKKLNIFCCQNSFFSNADSAYCALWISWIRDINSGGDYSGIWGLGTNWSRDKFLAYPPFWQASVSRWISAFLALPIDTLPCSAQVAVAASLIGQRRLRKCDSDWRRGGRNFHTDTFLPADEIKFGNKKLEGWFLLKTNHIWEKIAFFGIFCRSALAACTCLSMKGGRAKWVATLSHFTDKFWQVILLEVWGICWIWGKCPSSCLTLMHYRLPYRCVHTQYKTT